MQQENRLWYRKPAQNWNEALPVGNGILGGMVFGNPLEERIQLNEDSVWSGDYIDRNNRSTAEWIPEIRATIQRGDLPRAERLAKYAMTGTPDGERVYQTMGDLFIGHFDCEGDLQDYRRELDLSRAVCTTQFRMGDTAYRREVLVSRPDHVLAVHLTAEKGTLHFHVKIGRRRFMHQVWTEGGNTIGYDGGEGIRFTCMLRASAVGGSMQVIGEYLIIEGATEATLYLTAGTTYRQENPADFCRGILDQADGKGYAAIYRDHLKDYQPLYERSSLQLAEHPAGMLPTDERLAAFASDRSDQGLVALYYHYGRYLLLSSSRPGSLPANLQGIWCDSLQPPWDSKYTININTEMNYWPAEVCALSECHLPLFSLLETMHPNGVETARVMYGARGWLAHHNTDVWGSTAPQDTYIPSTFWVMGAPWLCTHIWEHYEYTLDRDFLAKHFYLLRDASLFFLDYLTTDDQGWLVISPTVSPENTYSLPDGTQGRICGGCTMDSQIIRHLFDCCIGASAALEQEADFAAELRAVLEKLPPTAIGSDGRIMEWLEEYEEPQPGHRHISHLYGLFPGAEISPQQTPELAQAARKTLDARLASGGGHTGWSRAWIINFWAKLGDGIKTQENIEQLLVKSTLPNLLDNHPPFQIDGNFGGTAGIANALLQSEGSTLILLPALPPAWKTGQITGLRAKYGLTVSVAWHDGALEQATVQAGPAFVGSVRYGEREVELRLAAGESKCLRFDMP